MENLSIMKVLSMLAGLKPPEKPQEQDAPAAPFGTGGILSALAENKAANPVPAARESEKTPPHAAGRRVNPDKNPLILAMQSHEAFVNRVNGKNKP